MSFADLMLLIIVIELSFLCHTLHHMGSLMRTVYDWWVNLTLGPPKP